MIAVPARAGKQNSAYGRLRTHPQSPCRGFPATSDVFAIEDRQGAGHVHDAGSEFDFLEFTRDFADVHFGLEFDRQFAVVC